MRFFGVRRLLLVLFLGLQLEATENFKVREAGKDLQYLELVTPWGTKAVVGDSEINLKEKHNYRIEIPIETIRPPPPPETPTVEAPVEEPEEIEPAPEKKEETKVEEKPTEPTRVIVEYDDSDRLILEANRLYNRGKFYEATVHVDELLRRKPYFIRGWVMKGSLLHVQGQKDLAKNAWQKALNLDPENKELQELLNRYK